jgi:hypothetical protein
MRTKLNNRTEGTLAIVAAFLVLFSAMWHPLISLVVSVVGLVVFGLYKLTQTEKPSRQAEASFSIPMPTHPSPGDESKQLRM